jgi:trimeric autotransporter adhesin
MNQAIFTARVSAIALSLVLASSAHGQTVSATSSTTSSQPSTASQTPANVDATVADMLNSAARAIAAADRVNAGLPGPPTPQEIASSLNQLVNVISLTNPNPVNIANAVAPRLGGIANTVVQTASNAASTASTIANAVNIAATVGPQLGNISNTATQAASTAASNINAIANTPVVLPNAPPTNMTAGQVAQTYVQAGGSLATVLNPNAVNIAATVLPSPSSIAQSAVQTFTNVTNNIASRIETDRQTINNAAQVISNAAAIAIADGRRDIAAALANVPGPNGPLTPADVAAAFSQFGNKWPLLSDFQCRERAIDQLGGKRDFTSFVLPARTIKPIFQCCGGTNQFSNQCACQCNSHIAAGRRRTESGDK